MTKYQVWVRVERPSKTASSASNCAITTLIPSDHVQADMLTQSSTLAVEFEARTWDEAVARKQAFMSDETFTDLVNRLEPVDEV